MMGQTIRKTFKMEMAHQLSKAFSKCCTDTIHGHSYKVEVFLRTNNGGVACLNDAGMVVDFGEIKDILNDYFDQWDHALVMPSAMDGDYIYALKNYNKKLILVDYNPTAEMMARDMYGAVDRLLKQCRADAGMSWYVCGVRVHETETGYAEFGEVPS